ncbi:glycosyl hydrolase [Haladaptatus sp. AB618]|uniref:glycosyl hydrolase n=1 Tax=Haladaptatus sp. AB618 TaxID=2934173 RepID=UPI00209C0718|nr:glycosyl hydrolase [Haladaptatus sp. AB618]MCO8256199.1 glycosyl hydrolase [Haladaptatus sp. AB618]
MHEPTRNSADERQSQTDESDEPAESNDGLSLSRRTYFKAFGAAGLAGAAGIPAPAMAASDVHGVGNGSYAGTKPSGEDGPPSTLYTTGNVQAPLPSNDWWTSALVEGYSENLFFDPGYGQAVEAGLEVGNPSTWTISDTAAIMDVSSDFTLGHTATSSFADTRVDGHSDWSVTLKWGSATGTTLRASLTTGLPFVFCEYTGGGAELDFPAAPNVWADRGNVLGVTHNGNHYGLFAPSGDDWSGTGSATLTNGLSGGYLSIAILPDGNTSTLDTFEEYAYNFVMDTGAGDATRVSPTYDQSASEVRTTYSFNTDDKAESQASGTITGLYPHQHKYTDEALLSDTYVCPRGTMKTTSGSSFTTTHPFRGVLPYLPDRGTYDESELSGYVGDVSSSLGGSDTYSTGKEFGRAAAAAPIADQVGNTSKRDALYDAIQSRMEDWLVAGSSESSNLFYYDDSWGTFIGYPDSYGSASGLNDHHFHYGYFVRGAAALSRTDDSWGDDGNWGGMVDLIVRDFANWERPNRANAQEPATNPADSFPFLRNFSPFGGHSWAAGTAEFADGNDQESSSEAINAYGAMVEWAVYTDNDEMLNWAAYLYTHEVISAMEYWFDVDDGNQPDAWGHDTAGIVWSDKYSYATWFNADAEAVHGINYLPYAGHSLYLGWDADLAERNYSEAVANDDNGGAWNLWPDIMWNYRVFSNPSDAKSMFQAKKGSYTPESGETKAHTYHWIYAIDGMGNPNPSVTADYPLAYVFGSGSDKTYVAYNGGNAAITVNFSDGTSLSVGANSMNSSTGGSSGGGSGDSTAPSSPSNLSSSGHTTSSVDLGWSAASDTGGSGLDHYAVYVNGSQNGTVSAGTTSTTVSGLSGGTTYDFSVTAVDGAGNESSASNTVSVTTNSSGSGDFNQSVSRIDGSDSDSTVDELSFTFVSNVGSNWVDVHYTVNGGSQYNYRMNKSGDTHTLETTPDYVVGDFSSGDAIDYYFTYENGGTGNDSQHFSLTY